MHEQAFHGKRKHVWLINMKRNSILSDKRLINQNHDEIPLYADSTAKINKYDHASCQKECRCTTTQSPLQIADKLEKRCNH